jgi:hypothetical protein
MLEIVRSSEHLDFAHTSCFWDKRNGDLSVVRIFPFFRGMLQGL